MVNNAQNQKRSRRIKRISPEILKEIENHSKPVLLKSLSGTSRSRPTWSLKYSAGKPSAGRETDGGVASLRGCACQEVPDDNRSISSGQCARHRPPLLPPSHLPRAPISARTTEFGLKVHLASESANATTWSPSGGPTGAPWPPAEMTTYCRPFRPR